MHYYISKDATQLGPFTEIEIANKVNSGQLVLTDLCVSQGGNLPFIAGSKMVEKK